MEIHMGKGHIWDQDIDAAVEEIYIDNSRTTRIFVKTTQQVSWLLY
jgi:hypothetical protein